MDQAASQPGASVRGRMHVCRDICLLNHHPDAITVRFSSVRYSLEFLFLHYQNLFLLLEGVDDTNRIAPFVWSCFFLVSQHTDPFIKGGVQTEQTTDWSGTVIYLNLRSHTVFPVLAVLLLLLVLYYQN